MRRNRRTRRWRARRASWPSRADRRCWSPRAWRCILQCGMAATPSAKVRDSAKNPIQVIERMMKLLDVLSQHPERLGMRLLELGNLVKSRISVRELALPLMRELHSQTGETANLSVRHDDEIVYVERTSSGRSAMRVVHVIGARASLHVTAAGKLFLLEDGFARLRDYAKRTGLAMHTKNTITSLPLLEKDLERTQRQGWATDSEEAEIGVRCVAAGIRDDAGHLVAALSLSTPADRMKAHWGPLVKETADRISSTIGHRPTSRIGAV